MPVEFPPEAIEPLKMTKAQLEHWASISDTESKYLLASRYVALAKSLPLDSYEGANWYKYVLVAHWLLYMIGESNNQLYGVISKLCSWTAHTYELQEENKMLTEEVIRLKERLKLKETNSWDEPCELNQFSDFHVVSEAKPNMCSYCGAIK